MQIGDKVKIPLRKLGLDSGSNFNSFKRELKEDWKYLTISSLYGYEEIGVEGPNGECIESNLFNESDLELFEPNFSFIIFP